MFRLNKPTVQFIIEKLESKSRPTEIPFKLKILCALHFFGHGSYQVSIGSCQIISLSQPSVSRVVTEITKLIVEHLMNEFIKFPQTVLEQAEIKSSFNEKFEMSEIIGAIDGCHVAIVAPPEHHEFYRGNLFRNRKGYHSINTLICCDANMRILYVNSRFPGSVHDSAIWMTSKLRAHFLEKFNSIEDQTNLLLGDSGFPLEPWLLTNFSNPRSESIEFQFNEKFIRARNIIEKCFGVLKSRFRCLLRHRTLHYHPYKASKIIYAICTLHNIHIARKNNDDDDCLDSGEDYIEENDGDRESGGTTVTNNDDIHESLINLEPENGSWHTLGARVRNLYMNKYFDNFIN